MHYLDELFVRNTLENLERAVAALEEGRFGAEILATMNIKWAMSDLKIMLDAPLKERV